MMHRFFVPLIVLYAGFVLEVSGVGASASGVEPRWGLLALAWCVWSQRLGATVLWGALCGLLMDAYAAVPLGPGLLLMATLAWVLALLRKRRRWTSATAFLLLTHVLACLGAAGFELIQSGVIPSTQPEWIARGWRWSAQGALTALWGGMIWLAATAAIRLGRIIGTPSLSRRFRTRGALHSR